MNFETLIIELVIVFAGVISTFAVTKNKVDNLDKKINHVFKAIEAVEDKVNLNTISISEHELSIKNNLTMIQADERFVSKEMFKQMEKHIDRRFDELLECVKRGK